MYEGACYGSILCSILFLHLSILLSTLWTMVCSWVFVGVFGWTWF
jgi:hypothetical protein